MNTSDSVSWGQGSPVSEGPGLCTGFAGARDVTCGLPVHSIAAEAAFSGKNCMPGNASGTKLPKCSSVS
jgi:hypothetical protein